MDQTDSINLQDAIRLGEYDPELLSGYPEWAKFSRAAQFELISQGLEYRRQLLFKKWQRNYFCAMLFIAYFHS